MGYHFKRIILPAGDNSEKVKELAKVFRTKTNRNCTFTYSDFSSKKYRRDFLKAANAAQLNFAELDTPLFSEQIIETTQEVLGENNFLYRASDDDELDVLYPSKDWLQNHYPNNDFNWLLQPIEDVISLNTKSYYSIPSNPDFIDISLPIFAALLKQVRPGEEHPCPICGLRYVSKFPRRHCRNPECSFGYIPFEDLAEALSIKEIQLDAFAWGRCPRNCGNSLQFTNRIEQCYKCGQLIKAIDGKFNHVLKENESEIVDVINQLNKSKKSFWRFWK
jgi:hypothetical protein